MNVIDTATPSGTRWRRLVLVVAVFLVGSAEQCARVVVPPVGAAREGERKSGSLVRTDGRGGIEVRESGSGGRPAGKGDASAAERRFSTEPQHYLGP